MPLARPRQPHPAGPRGTVTPTRMDARPGSLRGPQSMHVCGEHVETPSYKPALDGDVRLCPATAPEEACQALAGGERGLEPGGRTVCRGSGRACEGSQVLLAVPPPVPLRARPAGRAASLDGDNGDGRHGPLTPTAVTASVRLRSVQAEVPGPEGTRHR